MRRNEFQDFFLNFFYQFISGTDDDVESHKSDKNLEDSDYEIDDHYIKKQLILNKK